MINIYFIGGASGSGKTAIMFDLKKIVGNALAVYDFDDIGIPDDADTKWRQEATEKWLQKLLRDEKDACLLGQIVLGEILACPSAKQLNKINFCLLDVGDFERIQRLKKRNTYGLDQNMLNWSSWLRMHHQDPQWMQHVIKDNCSDVLDFRVWDKLNSWNSLANVKLLDTTKLSIMEVAKTASEWIADVSQLLTHQEVLCWAKSAIDLNDAVNHAIETVVQTPWSSVLKINTSQGLVYLKQTPPNLFIEVEIIQKCRDLCKITNIPEVIAENKGLHCFLMKECGDVSLRTLFDGHLNVDLLVQGLHTYKVMQQATVSHVDAFIQAGVPDWRLSQFPKLYQDLMSNEAFLKMQGLEAAQIKILQDSLGHLEALCLALSSYGVPECLNHSDFHENNMLFSKATQKISIIDLGEMAINHPFFSLAAFLKIPCNRYKVAVGSSDYQILHDACFQGWLPHDQDLSEALALTEKLLPIYLTFAHMRLVNATCPVALNQIQQMKNRVKEGFVWFIKNLESYQ